MTAAAGTSSTTRTTSAGVATSWTTRLTFSTDMDPRARHHLRGRAAGLGDLTQAYRGPCRSPTRPLSPERAATWASASRTASDRLATKVA
jgi:hypothetical protein